MPIAGVIVLANKDKTADVLERLKGFSGVTTYGVHQDDSIIAVLEAGSPEGLEQISRDISEKVDGVLGVFPAYVRFDDEGAVGEE
jgi:nitrate reductase NapAB chaperone NapD